MPRSSAKFESIALGIKKSKRNSLKNTQEGLNGKVLWRKERKRKYNRNLKEYV